MIKCIKEKCPRFGIEYMEDEVYHFCKIADIEDDYIFDDRECIGIPNIQPAIEKIGHHISKLATEINSLAALEDFIKDNQ